MTVIGIHNVVDQLTSYTRGTLSFEGGLWLIWMNGLLLVPLVFAAFFYPMAAAEIGAVVAAVTIAGVLLCNRLRL